MKPDAGSGPRGIVTPEGVPLEFETASIGSRGVAFGIDLLIMGAMLVLLLVALGMLDGAQNLPGWLAVSAALLIVTGVQFGYPIAFETLWRGRTPGKAAMGLRVVTVEGAPVRFRHATIRALLGLVDFLLTSGAAAVLSILFTSRDQRLGDLVAGTLVLRERSGQRPSRAVTFEAPPGLEPYAERVDTSALGHDVYGAIRAFLLRADTLHGDVRSDLAHRLATEADRRISSPPPPRQISAEEFLRSVAAAHQRRGQGVGRQPQPPPGGPPPGPRQADTVAATEPRDDERRPDAGGFAPPT